MGWSCGCYIPSFVEIGPPEKKIFEGFKCFLRYPADKIFFKNFPKGHNSKKGDILEKKKNTGQLFLAHLSRRLIGELIGYSWSGVCPSVRPQCSKIFFSKTAWPIKAKFYVEPPWVGGTKVCLRHVGHDQDGRHTPIW